jgi:DNA-binding CsgD family transcriptional regulator/tetratricopeptide (TPR) repeat protein
MQGASVREQNDSVDRRPPLRTSASWPLVGRDAELAVLEHALHDRGGVVVAGAAGVGKTRLLREAEALARRDGAHVERIAASRAAASVPLGAFAHLRPDRDADDVENPLGAVRSELTRRASGTRLVLVVDDAHTLDAASAALVHQLAADELRADGHMSVLVAVRSREPTPDAIVALWKDDLCERVELQPLSRIEAADLLEHVLGGPVEAATAHALWDASRGNVMFLRELVQSGLDSGALAARDGLWAWPAPRHAAPRLAELLADNLAALTEPERAVLEVLALGEPLDWDVLVQLVASEAAEELVERHLVETETVDGSLRARLGHPLVGEVLHSELPDPKRRRLLRALADETDERRDEHDPRELLRVVTWRLDAGVDEDPARLVAAARACVHMDIALAERIAREAYRRGAGFPAADVLTQVHQFTQRPHDTDALLADVDPASLSPDERVRLAVMRANNLTWALARPDDAVALLEEAALEFDGDEALELAAHIPPMLLFAGRVREAAERAQRTVADPERSAVHRLHAYLGLLPSLAAMGKPETALALLPDAMALVPECAEDLPIALGQLASSATLAQQWVGQLDAAEALMRAVFEDGVARDVPLLRGGTALRLGQIALWRGAAHTAAGLLRESMSALQQFDAGFLAWAAHTLRLAYALLGDLDAAADARERAEHALVYPLYTSEEFRADAWVAAAEGHLSRACAIATEGAAWSLAHDHLVPVVWLSWDRARFGEPVEAAVTIEKVAPRVEGVLARALAVATTGLAARDGAALDTASDDLEAHGYVLFAAECARAAARLHGAEGLRAREAASDARADSLAVGCEGASTPLLAQLGEAPTLTRREREIAGLAARGRSDAEIADELGVSVRTVESHLHRAYAKLGVTSRQQLASIV